MDKNVNSKLIKWIHTFFTGRLQYVRFKDYFSNCTTTNTGAPQGYVLSASLFTIYESDNSPENESCVIIKYVDDTVILGLLGENDDHIENFYTSAIDCFNHWCKVNFLDFNEKKTKEIVIDFREKKPILELETTRWISLKLCHSLLSTALWVINYKPNVLLRLLGDKMPNLSTFTCFGPNS